MASRRDIASAVKRFVLALPIIPQPGRAATPHPHHHRRPEPQPTTLPRPWATGVPVSGSRPPSKATSPAPMTRPSISSTALYEPRPREPTPSSKASKPSDESPSTQPPSPKSQPPLSSSSTSTTQHPDEKGSLKQLAPRKETLTANPFN